MKSEFILEWGSRGLEFESQHSDQKWWISIEIHHFFARFCSIYYLNISPITNLLPIAIWGIGDNATPPKRGA